MLNEELELYMDSEHFVLPHWSSQALFMSLFTHVVVNVDSPPTSENNVIAAGERSCRGL